MNMKTTEQWRNEFEQAEELAGDWPKAFADLLSAVRQEAQGKEVKPVDEAKKVRELGIAWLEEEIPHFAAKVEPVFAALNWSWFMKGVPNKAAIEETLRELWGHVGQGSTSAKTGGLTVELDESKSPAARISMEISSEKYISISISKEGK